MNINLQNKLIKLEKVFFELNKMEKYFNESGINYRKNFMIPFIDQLFELEI